MRPPPQVVGPGVATAAQATFPAPAPAARTPATPAAAAPTAVQSAALGPRGTPTRLSLQNRGLAVQAATSSTASPDSSLSGTAIRQFAATAAHQELRREPPRGQHTQQGAGLSHMPGRHLGAGGGGSRGNAANEGSTTARASLTRGGSNAPSALSSRAGSGVRGSSPRTSAATQRPSLGPTSGRYPTARPSSQRPSSRGVGVPRQAGTAATARGAGSLAGSPASLHLRHGA
mmetsp:Transcript_10863/g.29581  ORF Transcript_10863/g.29581 Transcript_10863/m.29581 type:complete len:231 (+) Transcript_10863:1-693(+)